MSKCNIITHRGANKYAPQNTLPAFKKAVEIGTDGFETDVHLTKDGQVVLCHNYTIDETSDGKGNITDMMLDELKRYDFGAYFNEKFKGTEIPTLEEFLTFVQSTDIKILNIEIKPPQNKSMAVVEETIKMVKKFDLMDILLISSFSPDVLKKCKEIDASCKTGFLYSPKSPTTPTMFWRATEYAKSLKCDALHPYFLFVNEKYIKDAHDAGIMVNPWTVNNPDFIHKMIKLGADGIISDLPDVTGKIRELY